MFPYLDITFPNSKFFEPLPEFFEWLHTIQYNNFIFDCGAGIGHVEAEATKLGFRDFYSIDEHPRDDPKSEIIIMPCQNFQYPENSILLFCRPCHNGFVAETYELHKDSCSFYYIGLESNLNVDLFDIPHRLVLENIGEEGENIYVLSENMEFN